MNFLTVTLAEDADIVNENLNEINKIYKVNKFFDFVFEFGIDYVFNFRRSNDEKDPPMRDNNGYGFGTPGMPNYILSHSSSFKSAWTWFILILTLYTAWMVPYSVAFQE